MFVRVMLVLVLSATSAPAQDVKPELVLPLGHTGEIHSAAYSPDGRTVLTGGRDRIARLWDVASGKPIVKFTGHTSDIRSVAFAPVERKAVTGARDGSVKVWDATTGECLWTVKPSKNRESVYAVAVSPDGKTILAGLSDHSVVLLETENGKVFRTFADATDGHTSAVNAVAFDKDGKTILTGSDDKTVKRWDVKTGRTLQTYSGHESGVTSVAVSPDGKTLLTASKDSTARVWYIEDGKALQKFTGHSSYVYRAVFSPDGKQILTGSADKCAKLWDVETDKPVHDYASHGGYVHGVAFSPDGKSALTASADTTARIHDLPVGKPATKFKGHDSHINAVAVSPDGKTAATASNDYTVKLWDAATGVELYTLKAHKYSAKAVAFSPDGTRVLTGSADKTAILWDAGGKVVRTFTGHSDYVNAVAFTPDGRSVLTASGDKTVRLWDADTGKVTQEFKGHRGYVVALAVSPDGKTVATGAESDYDIRLWDVATGKETRKLKGHTSDVNSVAFSPDGKTLVSGSYDCTLKLWDVSNGSVLRTTLAHTSSVTGVAFSPDGQLVASVGKDYHARVWDLTTGAAVNTLGDPKEYFTAVAFGRDGRSVLLGRSNGGVGRWDIDRGRSRTVLAKTADTIRTVAVNVDPDRLLVAGGPSGRLWELSTGETRLSVVQNRPTVAQVISSDKKLALTVTADGTARLSDAVSKTDLCTIVTLGDGADWLVATPGGLFDGSPLAREQVAFKVGQSVVPVERFHKDFYTPGLLGDLVRGERPKPKVTVAAKPAPLVKFTAPVDRSETATGTTEVTVEATDQGGGVANFAVFHQGNRIYLPGVPEKDGNTYRRTFKTKLVEGVNRFEARASGDGGWESEPAKLTVLYGKPVEKPNLYVLAVGISDYGEDRLKLSFAASDAKALGGVFERRGKQMYAEVNVTYLLDKQATREGIRNALAEIAKKAQKQDTLVVTVAGHGTTIDQRYFFLPHEYDGKKFPTMVENVKRQGLPVDELGEAIRQVAALKKVLVLDTCGSGGATKLLQVGRNPFAFRGEIERLNRAEGVFVIAACAASEEAQEPKGLGHGVLTYALLAGLKAVEKGPLKDSGPDSAKPTVDVLEWFNFAAGQTPKLMKDYFGREQDALFSSNGTSFPLLPARDK